MFKEISIFMLTIVKYWFADASVPLCKGQYVCPQESNMYSKTMPILCICLFAKVGVYVY